jgi:ABC-2 type transport system permease protein
MKVLSMVRVNLLRSLRDRLELFFTVLLPLILILVLGLTYGSGASMKVGVADADGGALASDLVSTVESTPGWEVDLRRYGSVDQLRDAASRGIVDVAIAIPAGYTADLTSGGSAQVTVLTTPTQRAIAARTVADQAIAAETSVIRAAQFSAKTDGIPFATALAAARSRAAEVPGVTVAIQPVNAASTDAATGFSAGAQSQLILFMFLTSLTGAVELVITRQLGVSRRLFSTPTGATTIIVGESLARIAFALAQGIFIVAASALLFGVQWGDPLSLAAVIGVFSLVAGGAAMVIGAVASNPSQAGALGPALGLLLGLLGGAMVPLEVFPSTMQTVARLTPHAWAMDALAVASEAGRGIADIAPQLGVLLAFSVVFFAIAVARFRRVLVGAA